MTYCKKLGLLVISSLFSLQVAASTLKFVAGGTMNHGFDPETYSVPVNGTPWSILAKTSLFNPDLDADPNVGSFWAFEGYLVIGDDQFNLIGFPLQSRTFNVFNSTVGTTSQDRATLEVSANVGRPMPLSIGPNVIANFFVAMETADDQLVDHDALEGLIGLSLGDLCFSPPCSAAIGSRFGIQLFKPGEYFIELKGELEYLSIEAVPVPAAFWLFGSALGLLAWHRKRPNMEPDVLR